MPVLVHAAHRTLGRALTRRLLEEGGQVRATASDGVALLRAEGVFTAACDADDEGTLEAARTQVHTLVVLLGGLGRADTDGVRQEGLAAALAASRADDLKRAVTTVGPHRDDLDLSVNAMPARTHASQGEQRTLALAMRMAVHRLVADRVGTPPILVLDDVLSELDAGRARALLGHLPVGQVILTTATALPEHARPDRVLRIAAGCVIGNQ